MPPTTSYPLAAQPSVPSVALSADALAAAGARIVALGYTGASVDYTLGVGAEAALTGWDVDAFAVLDRAKADGSGGATVVHELYGHPSGVEAIVLVGLGAETTGDYRRAGAAVTRATAGRSTAATSIGALADDAQLGAFVEGLVLGRFGYARTSGKPDAAPLSVTLTDIKARPSRASVVDSAVARASASWRSRTFALTPSSEKSPHRLEDWARDAAAAAGLKIDVWDEKRLAADGFGGILAVGSGSPHESRFVRLDYVPARATRSTPHYVIVGKGITFDTGGISIKPRVAMENMKRDMTGAGVVIAVMGALRELGVKSRVTGLVASAENSFGAASMRPGDVIKHYGGRTSEVGNTDAEGRLVLGDALAYAAEHIDASAVVDVATLTGAGKVALGTTMGALFANDDSLATELIEASQAAGEPLWRLPLSAEYEHLLASPFADASNNAGGPGAVTAALFLQHFTGSAPWAHLDIASVGDSPKDAFEYTQGATGFGARLLLRWLAS